MEKNVLGKLDKQWHIPVAAEFIPAGLLLISMPFIIESPRWLVSKNRIAQATTALCWVRNLPAEHAYIKAEMKEIQASITHELEVSDGRRSTIQIFRGIGAPGIRNRVFSVLLMLLQNLIGINAINYYSPTILKAIRYSGTSVGLLATGIYGLVKMFTTLIFMMFFVDRSGRRLALLVGAGGAMIAMFYLAGYSAMSGSFEGMIPARDYGSQAAERKGVALENMDILFGSGAPILARAARKRYMDVHKAGINTVTISHAQDKEHDVSRDADAKT